MPEETCVKVVRRNLRWEVRVNGIARPLVDWSSTKERAPSAGALAGGSGSAWTMGAGADHVRIGGLATGASGSERSRFSVPQYVQTTTSAFAPESGAEQLAHRTTSAERPGTTRR